MIKFITIYIAGVLTIFSPCILPMLPILFNGVLASSKKKFISLLLGLVCAYTIFGWSLAYFGRFLGLNENEIRNLLSYLFIFIGSCLVFQKLSSKVEVITTKLTSKFNNYTHSINTDRIYGPFLLGVLFGIIWTPCTGPILTFASSLAASKSDPTYAFILMLGFGFGSVTPLYIIGTGLKKVISYEKINTFRTHANLGLGLLLILFGLAVLTNTDRKIQSLLVSYSPEWLLDLATLL